RFLGFRARTFEFTLAANSGQSGFILSGERGGEFYRARTGSGSPAPVRIDRRLAVIEPTFSSERILTGTCRGSSVNQMVIDPSSLKIPPASIFGSTTMVWNVPAGVPIVSVRSTFACSVYTLPSA